MPRIDCRAHQRGHRPSNERRVRPLERMLRIGRKLGERSRLALRRAGLFFSLTSEASNFCGYCVSRITKGSFLNCCKRAGAWITKGLGPAPKACDNQRL